MDNGNRTSKKTYAYTTGTINTNPTDTQTYTYGQNNWGDLLNTVNGISLTYDAIGNPINYYNGESYTFSWTDGRRLSSASYGGKTLSFTYNDEGIRTSKTVDGVTHYYTLEGTRIISERWGSNFIVYLYDESGAPIGMQYRSDTTAEGTFSYFYFEKNLQGDIIAVYNESGTRLVSYTYDAWGNISYTFYGGGAHTAVQHNPFRYRGYYYDDELDFYYLNSRYYDPNTGRFLNADEYINANGDLLGFNMFVYCSNNPIMYVDPTGYWFDTYLDIVSLGGSIIEVVATPTNPWAWVGLAGDLIDIIPYITGIGEATRAYRITVNLLDDGSDVVKNSRKIHSIMSKSDEVYDIIKATGSYEITFKSGRKYVGKGGFYRAITSASERAAENFDVVTSISWRSAPNRQLAFIDEYARQLAGGFAKESNNLYNAIWSPGRRIVSEIRSRIR